jgi:hypothetical protein
VRGAKIGEIQKGTRHEKTHFLPCLPYHPRFSRCGHYQEWENSLIHYFHVLGHKIPENGRRENSMNYISNQPGDENDALIWAVSTGANELIKDIDAALLFTRFWRHWVAIHGTPKDEESAADWINFNKSTYAAFYTALLLNQPIQP